MNQDNYSVISKLLHRLALGNRAVAEMSFDIDQALAKNAPAAEIVGPPVFISGLARSGTTLLLHLLFQSGEFRSLTYRDMPFVLAPNLWRRITSGSRNDMVAEERAHGDGIKIDFDSPEAFEEVFWRVFSGVHYLGDDCLRPMVADTAILAQFRGYIAAIMNNGSRLRYLSKNNNNILRLSSIRLAFPTAIVVVPFRAPLQHAYSLMRQHRQFLREHAQNKFAQDYMTWLGHHEFGGDHRPFVFDGIRPRGMPEEDLHYWLQIWCDAYEFLLVNAPSDCVFLCYEEFCSNADTVWPSLLKRLAIDEYAFETSLRLVEREISEPVSAELMARSSDIHRCLIERISR